MIVCFLGLSCVDWLESDIISRRKTISVYFNISKPSAWRRHENHSKLFAMYHQANWIIMRGSLIGNNNDPSIAAMNENVSKEKRLSSIKPINVDYIVSTSHTSTSLTHTRPGCPQKLFIAIVLRSTEMCLHGLIRDCYWRRFHTVSEVCLIHHISPTLCSLSWSNSLAQASDKLD